MKKYNVTVNGVTYEVEIEEITSSAQAQSAPALTSPAQNTAAPAAPTPTPAPAPVAPTPAPVGDGEAVKAPMPGTILKMNVKVGDHVEKGGLVCILEAMKMENEIFSPVAGTVTAVNAAQGTSVATGDPIITLA